MALISCKNLSCGYDQKVIINNLSFDIEQGDYICIIGHNGVGKTTLIKTLLKLLKPIEGKIEYDAKLNEGIGYLTQHVDIQKDFPTSVYEVVLSGCVNKLKYRPFYSKEDKAKVDKYLSLVGLTKEKYTSIHELSGGQKQKVLLARALCANDLILILDEPTSALDPDAKDAMYKIFKKLNDECKTTIIMITHDIDNALNYSNKVLLLNDKYFYGSTNDYLRMESDNHE